MRIGVLSDIHANRVALEAVLADMPPVEELICAGDIIGYNPWPKEVLHTIRERAVPTVQGNHDRVLANGRNFPGNSLARAGIRHARQELNDEEIAFLGGLPTERLLFEDRVKVVHGHPENPDRYTYPEAFGPELVGEESVLIMGHTHVQHVEQTAAGMILNPGSVGQPRDGDPDAAYALLDLDEMDVELRRVPYDISQVEQAVAEADLPLRTASRLRDGR